MPVTIRASADEGELQIYDAIGRDWLGDGVTEKQISADLKAMGKISRLKVRINSGGGDVFQGVALYNILAQHAARKTVYVDGLAASAASVIAMAGDEIRMGAGAFVMIHNAWTIAAGDAADFRRQADLLDSVSAQLAQIYMRRTGQSEDKIRKMMAEETWMDADAAIANGFADRPSEDVVKIAASVDLSRFRNVPPALLAGMSGPSRPRLEARRAQLAAMSRT